MPGAIFVMTKVVRSLFTFMYGVHRWHLIRLRVLVSIRLADENGALFERTLILNQRKHDMR